MRPLLGISFTRATILLLAAAVVNVDSFHNSMPMETNLLAFLWVSKKRVRVTTEERRASKERRVNSCVRG